MSGRELFSFGSGNFLEGVDAKEHMESSSGRYLPVSWTLDTKIILERKKVFQHLESLASLEKAVPLRQLLAELEDAGEAARLSFRY